ncbi:MAG: 4Fe-4S dicluster domain-containing protein [Holophagales bacterium]|nr:4Fe-4S dicluster domain-containing protein [Holophagales bacterium]MYF05714.1 4Fe-4S dicluster domain-containing protein [Holophagales bacterium]
MFRVGGTVPPMDPTQATREVFWNIEYTWLVYVLMVPTLAVFGWGFWLKIRRWRAGQPEVRFDRLGERMQLFLKNAVGQGRTIKRRYAGIFHTLVYTGFIVLFLATTVVAIHHDTPLHIMKGHFYLIFQSLTVDIFGLFVMVGVALAAIRRWISKPKLLVYTDEASWILVTIFVMALTGFMIEGWRIAVTDDPWAAWSPIGNLFALASDPLMSDAAMQTGHVAIWWFHLVVAFGWIAWVPFSKMSHVFTAPLNIFTANLDGYGGSLKTIDFETAERFGINHLGDFTWKDLLDFDACTECGRCTDVCPANTVGKSLSPRDIILDLQALMHKRGDTVLVSGNGDNGNGSGEVELLPIIDQKTAVSPEALFACTTCAACMEACPVHIEQMPKIVDARRYLVMEEADFPEGMMDMMNSLESRQHPFAGTQFSRVDWTEGLDIDVMAEMDDPHEAEVLMWVGCGGALVERNRNTVRATAKLLQKAGVKFAILGREESCTGDPARRVGNEFLFEMLAKGNVETMQRYGVRKVVTSCPHCFNSFRNEYPQFGGSYEVYHHSQFLDQLLESGRLDGNGAAVSSNGSSTITFHDPCYLGRHNGEYDAPRNLLAKLGDARQVEMERSRNTSFCCGGGGGMAFVDEPPDQRVNQERAQEAVDTGADVVAVGCPFCATMLDDGVNARRGDRDVKVKDVAELLWDAVGEPGQAAP